MSEKQNNLDGLIVYGDAVKATQLDDGSVKLGGYLVRYGDPAKTDLVGDYFQADTDFGEATKSAGWFNHRMPVMVLGKSAIYPDQLDDVELSKDETGVFAEIIIKARNEYEKIIADMGIKGMLGWSSGTAPHVVDYETQPNGSRKIKRWPLGFDASLTPTPMEPRNSVMPLKSLLGDLQSETPQETDAQKGNLEADGKSAGGNVETVKAAQKPINPKMENDMTEEINKIELTEDQLKSYLGQAANDAVKAFREAAPAVESEGAAKVEVTLDEADRPFKNIAENAMAVKTYTLSLGRTIDPRLTRLAAKAVLGANEGIPAEGAFLLEPTLVKELIKPVHEDGPFSSAARKLPVGNDSNYGWINGVNETSRATGSRWGGIQGYRLAEAATITASAPTFRRINWELKKYAVLAYATDELLKDASQFSAIVQQGAAEEINFMANDDILNGAGTGGPTGILNSGCLVSQAKETGQTAATIVYENLVKMWQRLHPRNRANATWFINSEAEPQLDQLSLVAGTAALEPRYVTYSSDGVMRIKGRPVVVTEFNAALGTVGDIVLADMSEYLYWEKSGIDRAASIHLQFLTDQTAFRFIYRCDGQTAMASAITPYKGSATQSAFVALATRA